MAGVKRFKDAIADGTAEAEGNVDILDEIAATLVTFQIGFEILPGTASRPAESDLNPFEVQDEASYIRGE